MMGTVPIPIELSPTATQFRTVAHETLFRLAIPGATKPYRPGCPSVGRLGSAGRAADHDADGA